MTYGIQIFAGKDGKPLNTLYWEIRNYLDSFILPAGSGNGSKSYDIPAGRSLEVFCYHRKSSKDIVSYTYTVSGNTIHWKMVSPDNSAEFTVMGVG